MCTPKKSTNPLLLHLPNMYFGTTCKVMIVGQETNDWEGQFPHPVGVAHLLSVYDGLYSEAVATPMTATS
jgi:hypothetical protein